MPTITKSAISIHMIIKFIHCGPFFSLSFCLSRYQLYGFYDATVNAHFDSQISALPCFAAAHTCVRSHQHAIQCVSKPFNYCHFSTLQYWNSVSFISLFIVPFWSVCYAFLSLELFCFVCQWFCNVCSLLARIMLYIYKVNMKNECAQNFNFPLIWFG